MSTATLLARLGPSRAEMRCRTQLSRQRILLGSQHLIFLHSIYSASVGCAAYDEVTFVDVSCRAGDSAVLVSGYLWLLRARVLAVVGFPGGAVVHGREHVVGVLLVRRVFVVG